MFEVVLTQGQRQQQNEFTLYSFVSFVGDFTAVGLSIYGTIAFFLGHYQEFVVDKSMLKMLYKEHREDEPTSQTHLEKEADLANGIYQKEVFKDKIRQSSDFTLDYWTFLFIHNFLHYCFCCKNCCQRGSKCCKSRIRTFKKF